MKVALDIPEDIARRLSDRWSDLSRQALEALAMQAYRSDVLTAAEVGSLLGLSSRWEVEDVLSRSGAFLHYSEAEFAEDLQRLRATLAS